MQPVVYTPESVTTFVAVDPQTGERSLIAEVHPDLDRDPSEGELRAFEQRMFDRNLRAGLCVTRATVVVVRDLLSAMEFATNSFDRQAVSTRDLLAAAGLRPNAVGPNFVRQVQTWLEAVASSWSAVIPAEAIPLLVPEVVGNLAQANLETWQGALEPDDAR